MKSLLKENYHRLHGFDKERYDRKKDTAILMHPLQQTVMWEIVYLLGKAPKSRHRGANDQRCLCPHG